MSRMQALRQRRKDAGLTRLELWAHPDSHKTIKEFAKAATTVYAERMAKLKQLKENK